MAITASGLYGLTLEKFLIDTAGQSLEAEDNICGLVTDTETPNFDTDDFVNDLSANEPADGDYARQAPTTTEITISSGVLIYDQADDDYGAAVTITAAMAQWIATSVTADTDHQLFALQDFVTAATSTAGQFTVQHSATGVVRIDFTP